MAEDDADREREREAERRAEMASELERVGKDPEKVPEAEESLGSQSAPSGTVREDERVDEVDGDPTETGQADARELPDDGVEEAAEDDPGGQ